MRKTEAVFEFSNKKCIKSQKILKNVFTNLNFAGQ